LHAFLCWSKSNATFSFEFVLPFFVGWSVQSCIFDVSVSEQQKLPQQPTQMIQAPQLLRVNLKSIYLKVPNTRELPSNQQTCFKDT